ncbi:hypothetical protein OFN29_31670, partial [Escherichia coli]|nr:hypothetical protein [Escherichia coli]
AAAAAAAGISRDLLATMLEEDHAFWEAAAQAEGQAEARYARKIHEAADTNWPAASWWLERRRPHDYSLRQTVTVQTQKAIDEL